MRSDTKHLSLESYVCLATILSKGGWRLQDKQWRKGDLLLSTLEAAVVELTAQVKADTDRLLRQTVKTYGPA